MIKKGAHIQNLPIITQTKNPAGGKYPPIGL